MSLSTKILIIIGTLLLLGVVAIAAYEVHSINARQNAIEQEVIAQKQLADNITRAMAQWATKADLEDLAKRSNTNLDEIKKDLASLNANLTAINVSTSHSAGQVVSGVKSTNVVKTPDNSQANNVPVNNSDPYNYQSTIQQLSLNEDFGNIKVPFGIVGFSASQAAPWNINIAPRQYNLTTVLGTDENQRIIAYNKFSIHVNDKDYDVPINSSQIKQEYPMPKFTLINPRLYLGMSMGAGVNYLDGGALKASVVPNLSIQISSFGKYKVQPDLSILQVGVGYDVLAKKPDFLLTPVSYNIGQHLPLMNNLYIGPNIHITTGADISVGIGLTAGL